MVPVLCYWDVRSLGQPIRNLLVYKGVQFEDKRFKVGPPPEYDKWHEERSTLGLTFPNLPYYVDDDVRLTQSLAILRYLGRKHDLVARNDEETTELNVIEQQARDLCLSLAYVAEPDTKLEHGVESHAKKLGEVLAPWDDFLACRKWTLGDRLTYVDFLLYEGLDWHREFKAETLQRYPHIVEYLKRFEELPNIKEYFASGRYKKWPILSHLRKWGFKKPSEGHE
ncbi:glutathione S-transferase Mu 1-like [Dermacentor variabilis]|uniref:glutathione S-transferase Mu 1-like n=1 Tax=Dermacentor variabilis TaxID=34621 RepID=UPI003F5B0088